jgi:GH43 family beta-xylosidase
MHLAVKREDGGFLALNRSFGVLFPTADLDEGKRCGTTKVMVNPWIFRLGDGSFGVAALRRNVGQNGLAVPEPGKGHCVLFFRSADLLSYEEIGLVEAAPQGELISDLSCRWDGGQYVLSMETDRGLVESRSADLSRFDEAKPGGEAIRRSRIGVDDAALACEVPVTALEYSRIVGRLLPLENVGVKPIEMTVGVGSPFVPPEAELVYGDGSVFRMPVEWKPFDLSRKGSFTINGTLRPKRWPFPLMAERGDPMAIAYRGRYYFMATDDEHGQLSLKIREADSVDAIAAAEDHVILSVDAEANRTGCFWAPELHEIEGSLFIFFAAGSPHWYTVQSHVMKLTGVDPTNPSDWSRPRRCETKDGKVLLENGITLDMTVLNTKTGAYVIWAQREIGEDLGDLGTSDLYIASVDPREPWRQTSDPVLLRRPSYAWERTHSAVNEGPFVLRRGDDLFVTYAAALIDHSYCVGMLRAKDGDDLLDPDSWRASNYPVLHRQSVPDQIGAGHNSFVKNDRGEDILMIHAIPVSHYRNNPGDLRRYPAFRIVHWDKEGLPRLDMTPERELSLEFSEVKGIVNVI